MSLFSNGQQQRNANNNFLNNVGNDVNELQTSSSGLKAFEEEKKEKGSPKKVEKK